MSLSGNPKPLRILHLEDNLPDCELVAETLAADGLACQILHTRNRSEFEAALRGPQFDVILSDYSLPSYAGLVALAAAQKAWPGVPFIYVSGTIGEERAVDSLRAGATDYVLKERLERLGPVVRRALREAALRQAHQQDAEKIREQAQLLELAHDAIFVRDCDGAVRYWNRGAEQVYGWQATEILGRNIRTVLRLDAAAWNHANAALLASGAWQGEMRAVTQDGRAVQVNTTWTLLRDAQGHPKSVLVISTNITERKAVEVQLLRSQRLESLGTLAGGIAHDLNNTLAPIVLVAELLEAKLTQAADQPLLQTLKSSARRATNMVKQIVTFARGTHGERTPLQMDLLLRELTKILDQTFLKTVRIRTRVPPKLWLVTGDLTQLHQVFMNLCVNARDAMPEGGTLTLSAENVQADEKFVALHPEATAGPYVAISVTDTGAGMPPEVLRRIFEPFFTTKPIGQGTGLGLPTAHGIVKSHGGFITVASEPGKGTQFWVYLPAQPLQPETAAMQEVKPAPSGNGELILVVDDEAAIRAMASQVLRLSNYRVLLAENGADAMARFIEQREEINLVLTDLMMPIMDGKALIRALRSLHSHLRIIGCSGLDDTGRAPDPTLNVQAFLQKPATARKLLETVHRVLNE